jgi:allantoin racemase
MKLLIVNPNSDPKMTAVIRTTAEVYAAGAFRVVCMPTPGATGFIDSYQDEIEAAPGMLELVREHGKQFDGFLVACMDDPNLDAVKEITGKPVVGIAEAAMKIASMIGHRFSIVSTSRTSIANHQVLARKYHLEALLASVRYPEGDAADLSEEARFFEAAWSAVEEDLAEVIVLGCAGLADMAKRLETRLNVPVLDGVVCGLIILSGMVKAGISTSKIGRYRPRGV